MRLTSARKVRRDEAPAPFVGPQEFDIDYEPTPKLRPRVVRGRDGRSHAFTPARTATAERAIKLLLLAKKAKQYPPGMPLRVVVGFRMPRPRAAAGRQWAAVRPDLDQLLKLVLDAGNGILWDDDGQVAAIVASKTYVAAGADPAILLTVTPLSESGEQEQVVK